MSAPANGAAGGNGGPGDMVPNTTLSPEEAKWRAELPGYVEYARRVPVPFRPDQHERVCIGLDRFRVLRKRNLERKIVVTRDTEACLAVDHVTLHHVTPHLLEAGLHVGNHPAIALARGYLERIGHQEGQDGAATIVHTVCLTRFMVFVFKVNLHLRMIEHPREHQLEFERIAGEFESFRGSIDVSVDPATRESVISFRASLIPTGRMMGWTLEGMGRKILTTFVDALRTKAESI